MRRRGGGATGRSEGGGGDGALGVGGEGHEGAAGFLATSAACLRIFLVARSWSGAMPPLAAVSGR